MWGCKPDGQAEQESKVEVETRGGSKVEVDSQGGL